MKKNRVVVAVGVVAMLVGGAALAAGLGQASTGGYLTTPREEFRTSTAALLTDEIDVGSGRPADPEPDLGELSRVRIRVTSTDADAAIFVGIGPRDAVHSYLQETSHDVFTGASTNPFHATFASHSGHATAPPPAAAPIWVANASGKGEVTLEWDKAAGPWSLVVANTDGRPGLHVRADLGFRFGFLTPTGAGVLLIGVVLIGAGLRSRRRRR